MLATLHPAIRFRGGYTNPMFSECRDARILVSIYASRLSAIAVCYGDPMAWIAADLFLIPISFVYRSMKRQVLTRSLYVCQKSIYPQGSLVTFDTHFIIFVCIDKPAAFIYIRPASRPRYRMIRVFVDYCTEKI